MNNSTREFFRKWGSTVNHDALMMPTISPKYDIGFVIKNCDLNLLNTLEPWCSTIYVFKENIEHYRKEEQKNTLFDLNERVRNIQIEPHNDIVVEFDAQEFTPEQFNYLANLSEILSNDEELEVGEFELGIFKVKVNKIKTYEEELIVCESS